MTRGLRWFLAAAFLLLSLPFWLALTHARYFVVAKREGVSVFVGYDVRLWGSLETFNDIFSYDMPVTGDWDVRPLGFLYTEVGDGTRRYWNLDLSLWPSALTFTGLAVALAPWPLLWRRRRNFTSGLCPRCGYDLRASPERCPECGTAAKPAPVSN